MVLQHENFGNNCLINILLRRLSELRSFQLSHIFLIRNHFWNNNMKALETIALSISCCDVCQNWSWMFFRIKNFYGSFYLEEFSHLSHKFLISNHFWVYNMKTLETIAYQYPASLPELRLNVLRIQVFYGSSYKERSQLIKYSHWIIVGISARTVRMNIFKLIHVLIGFSLKHKYRF